MIFWSGTQCPKIFSLSFGDRSSGLQLEKTTGDLEAMTLYAGQNVGLIEQVLSAAEIIQQIIDDAKGVVAQFNR